MANWCYNRLIVGGPHASGVADEIEIQKKTRYITFKDIPMGFDAIRKGTEFFFTSKWGYPYDGLSELSNEFPKNVFDIYWVAQGDYAGADRYEHGRMTTLIHPHTESDFAEVVEMVFQKHKNETTRAFNARKDQWVDNLLRTEAYEKKHRKKEVEESLFYPIAGAVTAAAVIGGIVYYRYQQQR